MRRAIELRPANVANYLSLGNSHFYAGRYGDAIQSYIQGLEIQPDNVWLKSNLAAAYSYNGEPRKAIAVYESVADLDATMLSNLSTLYFDEERYQEAATLLERALVLEPRSAIKHGNLGDTYRQLGRTKDAAAEYRKAANLTEERLKVDDKDATALARHAVFDAKLGNAAQALQHIRRAVELTPDDNTVLYKRAVVHALLKQRDDAVEWLLKALENGYSRVPGERRSGHRVDQEAAAGRGAVAAGVGRRPSRPADAPSVARNSKEEVKMPYTPVQRIVTVEFLKDPRRKKEYEVRVTPEQVVLRYGDTIVWDVQGLPAGLADRVSFGKFYLLEPSPRVVSGKKGLQPFKPKGLRQPGRQEDGHEDQAPHRARDEAGRPGLLQVRHHVRRAHHCRSRC